MFNFCFGMFQPCVIFSSVFGPIEISIVDTVDVDSHLQFEIFSLWIQPYLFRKCLGYDLRG